MKRLMVGVFAAVAAAVCGAADGTVRVITGGGATTNEVATFAEAVSAANAAGGGAVVQLLADTTFDTEVAVTCAMTICSPEGEAHVLKRAADAARIDIGDGQNAAAFTVTFRDIVLDGGAKWSHPMVYDTAKTVAQNDEWLLAQEDGGIGAGNLLLMRAKSGKVITLVLGAGTTIRNNYGKSPTGQWYYDGGTLAVDSAISNSTRLDIQPGVLFHDCRGAQLFSQGDNSTLMISGGTVVSNYCSSAVSTSSRQGLIQCNAGAAEFRGMTVRHNAIAKSGWPVIFAYGATAGNIGKHSFVDMTVEDNIVSTVGAIQMYDANCFLNVSGETRIRRNFLQDGTTRSNLRATGANAVYLPADLGKNAEVWVTATAASADEKGEFLGFAAAGAVIHHAGKIHNDKDESLNARVDADNRLYWKDVSDPDPQDLDFDLADATFTWDGEPHRAEPVVRTPGVTVTYAASAEGPFTAEIGFVDPGCHYEYVRLEKEGYFTETLRATVKIVDTERGGNMGTFRVSANGGVTWTEYASFVEAVTAANAADGAIVELTEDDTLTWNAPLTVTKSMTIRSAGEERFVLKRKTAAGSLTVADTGAAIKVTVQNLIVDGGAFWTSPELDPYGDVAANTGNEGVGAGFLFRVKGKSATGSTLTLQDVAVRNVQGGEWSGAYDYDGGVAHALVGKLVLKDAFFGDCRGNGSVVGVADNALTEIDGLLVDHCFGNFNNRDGLVSLFGNTSSTANFSVRNVEIRRCATAYVGSTTNRGIFKIRENPNAPVENVVVTNNRVYASTGNMWQQGTGGVSMEGNSLAIKGRFIVIDNWGLKGGSGNVVSPMNMMLAKGTATQLKLCGDLTPDSRIGVSHRNSSVDEFGTALSVPLNGAEKIFNDDDPTKTAVIGANGAIAWTTEPQPSVDYEVTGFAGPQDGKPHGISVVPVTAGATVGYATVRGGEYAAVSPTFTEVGRHFVEYKVTCEGHATAWGTAEVWINRPLAADEVTIEGEVFPLGDRPVTPAVLVTSGGKPLTEGVDYAVTYRNNTGCGTASVTVTGIGDTYAGSVTKTYEIRKSVLGWTVELSPTEFTYDGAEKRPTVTVSDGGRTPEEGVEYDVVYADNVEPGVAKAKVVGIGDYSGTIEREFTIVYGADLYRVSGDGGETWEGKATLKLAVEAANAATGETIVELVANDAFSWREEVVVRRPMTFRSQGDVPHVLTRIDAAAHFTVITNVPVNQAGYTFAVSNVVIDGGAKWVNGLDAYRSRTDNMANEGVGAGLLFFLVGQASSANPFVTLELQGGTTLRNVELPANSGQYDYDGGLIGVDSSQTRNLVRLMSGCLIRDCRGPAAVINGNDGGRFEMFGATVDSCYLDGGNARGGVLYLNGGRAKVTGGALVNCGSYKSGSFAEVLVMTGNSSGSSTEKCLYDFTMTNCWTKLNPEKPEWQYANYGPCHFFMPNAAYNILIGGKTVIRGNFLTDGTKTVTRDLHLQSATMVKLGQRLAAGSDIAVSAQDEALLDEGAAFGTSVSGVRGAAGYGFRNSADPKLTGLIRNGQLVWGKEPGLLLLVK